MVQWRVGWLVPGRSALVVVVSWLLGCASPATSVDGTGPGIADLGSGGPVDSMALDAALAMPDSFICLTDADCNSPGVVCFNRQCIFDPCASDASTALRCTGNTMCAATCLPISDPCDHYPCSGGQVCVLVGGVPTCAPSCYQVPCVGVVCPAGEVCNPSLDYPRGRCVAAVPCAAPCPQNTICTLACVVDDPCSFITCGQGQVCTAGKCVADPCYGVNCPPGDVCINGSCIFSCPGPCTPTCATGPGSCGTSDLCGGVCGTASSGGCPMGQSCQCTQRDASGNCIAKACQCAPDCTGKSCGDADGCGGKCGGPCPAGQMCNTNHACVCAPSCSGKSCGDSDGCVGKCGGPCPIGQMCNASHTCVCAPDCAGKSCGDANGCGGLCNGPCPSGTVCKSGACCTPNCPPGRACGAGDGCGGSCSGSCTGTATCEQKTSGAWGCVCPPGQTYKAATGCVCKPDCTSTYCGAPDGCGGTCAGSCGCSLKCDAAHQCVPLCAAGTTPCGCTTCCPTGSACLASGSCGPAPQ